MTVRTIIRPTNGPHNEALRTEAPKLASPRWAAAERQRREST